MCPALWLTPWAIFPRWSHNWYRARGRGILPLWALIIWELWEGPWRPWRELVRAWQRGFTPLSRSVVNPLQLNPRSPILTHDPWTNHPISSFTTTSFPLEEVWILSLWSANMIMVLSWPLMTTGNHGEMTSSCSYRLIRGHSTTHYLHPTHPQESLSCKFLPVCG